MLWPGATEGEKAVGATGNDPVTAGSGAWPRLRVADWTATRDTLHLWTQVVGKIRLAKAPMVNHWWQVPLYVTPRGLTTSGVPDGRAPVRHRAGLPRLHDAPAHQ